MKTSKLEPGNRVRMSQGIRRRIVTLLFILSRTNIWRYLNIALALFIIALSADAQNYSIGWYKIGGGGGTSASSAYRIDGTVGQHDASGAMTGGSYSMTGGYWSMISVVQTPGMPALYITSSGNTVTVYWQNAPGCTLQQNGNVNVSAGWSTCGYSCTTSNGTNYVSITNPSGNLFFRLSR